MFGPGDECSQLLSEQLCALTLLVQPGARLPGRVYRLGTEPLHRLELNMTTPTCLSRHRVQDLT